MNLIKKSKRFKLVRDTPRLRGGMGEAAQVSRQRRFGRQTNLGPFHWMTRRKIPNRIRYRRDARTGRQESMRHFATPCGTFIKRWNDENRDIPEF